MRTDQELLELAAKAVGIEVTGYDTRLGLQIVNGSEDSPFTDYWNPLENDGDAFRLAVALSISFKRFGDFINIEWKPHWVVTEDFTDDPYAATRRAIVRAAAEIGAALK